MNIENSWFLLHGRVENVRFTLGGFFFLILLIPLQGVSEELMYRSFIMQTVSSWFKLPIAGLIVQTVFLHRPIHTTRSVSFTSPCPVLYTV